MLTQSRIMTNLEALITNIERCSEVEGCTKVTFPTLKKLSVNGKAFGTSYECSYRLIRTLQIVESEVLVCGGGPKGAVCVALCPARGGSPVAGFRLLMGHTWRSVSEGKDACTVGRRLRFLQFLMGSQETARNTCVRRRSADLSAFQQGLS